MSDVAIIKAGSVRSGTVDFMESIATVNQVQAALRNGSTPSRTLDKVAQLRKQALEEGREEGHQLGYMKGREQGKADGFREGHLEGQRAAERELGELMTEFGHELTAVQQQLQAAVDRWFADAEVRLSTLAIEAVRRILAAEMRLSRETAVSMTKEALQEVTNSNNVRIRINPADKPILEAHRDILLSASSSVRRIEFIEDPTLSGGCIIDTEGGVVDASFETKLHLIENAREEAA